MKKIDLSEIHIFDGAMGTRLLEKGYRFKPMFEEINITHPEVVKEIHQSYVDAGTDFITTNTFGVNGYKYKNSEYPLKDVIQAAIKNAKDVAKETNYIVLDIGPTGGMLEPYGEMTLDEAYGYFKEIVEIGKEDVDAILFETFMDIEEIKSGIQAAKDTCDLPIFATMTFESKGRTMMGVDAETMVHDFEELGVSALGVNCSLGPIELNSVVMKILDCTKLPVIVQPNAGLPHVHGDGSLHYDIDPDTFANAIAPWMQHGVTLIGGCCGSDANTIYELVKRFKHPKG